MNYNESVISSVEQEPTVEVAEAADTYVPSYKRERYLRNRPFLVVNIRRTPAEHVKTNVKGWAEELGNWKVFESASVVDRVNNKHLIESAVVIDVLNTKAVKNSFNGDPEEQVVRHYMTKYAEQITEAMQIWLSHVAAQAGVAA